MNAIHWLIFLGIIIGFVWELEGQQPLCLDRKPPFTYEVDLSFCSHFATNSCCAKRDDELLVDLYFIMEKTTPVEVWNNCSRYTKHLLCLKCSPYAKDIHDGGSFQPQYFPTLCHGFCEVFYDECKAVVKPFMDVITYGNPTFEQAALMTAIEQGSQAFCSVVGVAPGIQCYADFSSLLSDVKLANDLDQMQDIGPNSEAKVVPIVQPATVSPQLAHSTAAIQTQTQTTQTFDRKSGSAPDENTLTAKTQENIPKNSYEDLSNKSPNTYGCLCLEEIAKNLRLPVSLVSANDGSNRIFVPEQYGVVNIFYPNGTKLPAPLINIGSRIGPLPKVSEEGVGDIAFHPNFRSNGLFYMLFSTPEKINGSDHYSNLAEFRISSTDTNKADPEYFRLLLKFSEHSWPHNAEKLLFGTDNYLYIFTGDGGTTMRDPNNTAQNMQKYNGKVLRIDVDSRTGDLPYGIPPDNPFLEPLSDGSYALPEIYAVGFRNPWRCGIDQGDRVTGFGKGRIICGDVGQNEEEELDVIERGGNYGWNVMEGTQPHCPECKLAPTGNLVEPIFSYTRQTRLGKAVIGGEFYRGCLYPRLNGLYIWGDHYSGRLFRLFENGDSGWENFEIDTCDSSVCKAPLTNSYASKIVSFGRDENGEVYMVSVERTDPYKETGHLYRIVDPTLQRDPTECELEFIERATGKTSSNLVETSLDAFQNLKPSAITTSMPVTTSSTNSESSLAAPVSHMNTETASIVGKIKSKLPSGISEKEQYYNYLLELQKLSSELTQQTENENDVEPTESNTESKPTTSNPASDITTSTEQNPAANLFDDLLNDADFNSVLTDILSDSNSLSNLINQFVVMYKNYGESIFDQIIKDSHLEKNIANLLSELNIDNISTLFAYINTTGTDLLNDSDVADLLEEFQLFLQRQNEPNVEEIDRVFDDEKADLTDLIWLVLNEDNHEIIASKIFDRPDPLSAIIDLLNEPSTEGIITDFLNGPYWNKVVLYLVNKPDEAEAVLLNKPGADKLLPFIRARSSLASTLSTEPTSSTTIRPTGEPESKSLADKDVEENDDVFYDEKADIKDLILFVLNEDNHEKLAEKLFDRPEPLSTIIDLLNEPSTEGRITDFLNGPYWDKVGLYLVNEPDEAEATMLHKPGAERLLPFIHSHSSLASIATEHTSTTTVKSESQILADKDASSQQTVDQSSFIKEPQGTAVGVSKETDSLNEKTENDDAVVARGRESFLDDILNENDPEKIVTRLLEQEEPFSLVAELMSDSETRSVIKDLLNGPLGEALIDSLVNGLTPNQTMMRLSENSLVEKLFTYLLQTNTGHKTVRNFLNDVFFTGLASLVLPSDPNMAEEPEELNNGIDIEKLIALLENETDRQKFVQNLFKQPNALTTIIKLLQNPTSKETIATLLNDEYTLIQIGLYLSKSSSITQEIVEVLRIPDGKKLFAHLLRNRFTGIRMSTAIVRMYSDKLTAEPSEAQTNEQLLTGQINSLTVLWKIASMLDDPVLKKVLSYLLKLHVPPTGDFVNYSPQFILQKLSSTRTQALESINNLQAQEPFTGQASKQTRPFARPVIPGNRGSMLPSDQGQENNNRGNESSESSIRQTMPGNPGNMPMQSSANGE